MLPPCEQLVRRRRLVCRAMVGDRSNFRSSTGAAVSPVKASERDVVRETVEFDNLPGELIDQSTRETVDEKMIVELLGELLLASMKSHRVFLGQQEERVRELMQRIPDSPRFVDAELAEVYQ